MRRLLALAVVLAFIPLAQAQDPDAPPWAPDATLLYIDSNDAANGDAENTGFLSTIQDAGDDAALGPSGSCDTHTGTDVDFTAVPPADDVDLLHTFWLDPAQAGTATLGEGIEAKLYIGAGSCYGDVNIDVRIMNGDAVAAEGSKSGHRYNDASGNYPLANIPLTINDPVVDIAQMRLEVHITGKNGGATFMGIGTSRGFSSIEIPMLGYEPPAPPTTTLYENLTGDSLQLDVDFNGSAQWVYNWTGPAGDLGVAAVGNISVGTVGLHILGPEGELLNETVAGEFEHALTITVPAGNWTVTITSQDALGNMSLAVDAAPEDAVAQPSDGGADGGDEDGSDEGNSTAPKARDSPGIGALLPVLVVAFAVALRRRR